MKNTGILDVVQSSFESWTGNKGSLAIAIAGGAVLLSTAYLFYRSRRTKANSKVGLTTGSTNRTALRAAFVDYNLNSKNAAVDGSAYASFVATFFDISGQFNELGWGESFHSTVELAGKSTRESEAVYEARLATLCALRPGMRCLDVGCGIGGPMRTIAALSGSNIIGIDFDPRRIERTDSLNHLNGLDSLCSAVCMNMHDMDFPDESFDAAYAIETVCYSPDAERAYKEIYRVIKRGAIFVSYELVKTPLYEPTNPDHMKLLTDVTYGSGVADLRTAEDAIEAAKRVGFEHVIDYDIALESTVNSPWYKRLEKALRYGSTINGLIVGLLAFVGWMSPEEKCVHDMLVASGQAVVLAGKAGIMTPMHLIVLKKPDII